MTELVLDASVVIKWFHHAGERHVAEARSLRSSFEVGDLVVIAPPLLRLEIVNVAGRHWAWGETALVELAEAIDGLGFQFAEPDLARVAYWTSRGLSAYDGCYVAVAEEVGARLVTDDALIVRVAGGIATALGA